MAFSAKFYEQAKGIIDKRREKAETEAESRRAQFNLEEPEYRKYRLELIKTVRDTVTVFGMEPDKAAEHMARLRAANLAAQENIKRLLQKHGYAPDYLEEHYSCKNCLDTGEKDGKLCECMINEVKRLIYDEAAKTSPLSICRFEDFRTDLYPETSGTLSPRKHMTAILNYCKEYAADFDSDSPSLLFYGSTGLGKTHLSLAITGEVLKQGSFVLYNSAQNIFNRLHRIQFGHDDNGEYEAMLNECDLLIIDDLGAEFAMSFNEAALYNIINTRISLGLPTIISTNLDLKGIEERYTQRIASRIIGEYEHLRFMGNDLRQQIKEQQ